jgi:hypothetical protein
VLDERTMTRGRTKAAASFGRLGTFRRFALLGLALLAASCSTAGVITAPESSAPLRDPGNGVDLVQADGSGREYAVAEVGVHNAAPGIVRVLSESARTIGRLDFDGASREAVPDNNPGEGEWTVPLPEGAG